MSRKDKIHSFIACVIGAILGLIVNYAIDRLVPRPTQPLVNIGN